NWNASWELRKDRSAGVGCSRTRSVPPAGRDRGAARQAAPTGTLPPQRFPISLRCDPAGCGPASPAPDPPQSLPDQDPPDGVPTSLAWVPPERAGPLRRFVRENSLWGLQNVGPIGGKNNFGKSLLTEGFRS